MVCSWPPTTPTPTPTGARCHNTAQIPEPFNVLRALSLSHFDLALVIKGEHVDRLMLGQTVGLQ